jgi:prophage tail gpP-like protein
MQTHIVVKGDTLFNISRKYYGVGSKYMKIFNANPQLKSGNPNLIYPGEILFIPDDDIKLIKEESISQTVEAENIDDISIFIDGESIPVPPDLSLEVFFDTCADSYELTFPYDPDDEISVRLFKPYGLQEVVIFIGNKKFFTGTQEGLVFNSSSSNNSVISSGRTKTYILIKSNIPISGYPLERKNLTLDQILTSWILQLFGLGIDIQTDVGALFELITASETETIWNFISKLALQRGVVVSNTGEGKLLLHKPVMNLVASIELGVTVGIPSLNVTYNSNERFGNYIALSQSPGNGQNKSIVQDTNFLEQTYKVFTPSDTTAGNIEQAAKWEASKVLRDALTIPLPVPGWVNLQTNQLWEAGQYINLKAPQVRLKNGFNYLIRSVKYNKSADKKDAVLNLIPPQAYSGELLTSFPWE